MLAAKSPQHFMMLGPVIRTFPMLEAANNGDLAGVNAANCSRKRSNF